MRLIKNSLLAASLMLAMGCADAQNGSQSTDFAKLPKPATNEKVATFAGGCFWSLSEGLSELKGVDKVVSGYAGGTTKNPTYQQVSSRNTGHAESVQVYYDPKVVSYAELAKSFFYAHNPTELNRQGPDEGTDYRSIAFYRTPEEKATLDKIIQEINQSHHYPDKIVTQVVPYKVLYPAEKYHQGYYRVHPESRYIQGVSEPKVEKLRANRQAYLKPQFKNK
ncbi:peptide-methionine (S)-S-oxide reductase MsrA [Pedobacter sp. UYP30]|uniref:peptide-methionine (S)-S-oxide reductase MsrA n=1 Tax=Pedobacter sp. UYP30 TaxID=1756400 RepID=UPI003399C89F